MIQKPLDLEMLSQEISVQGQYLRDIIVETEKYIIGQHDMIEKLLIGLITESHILLEGLPGLAKTLAMKTLASAVNGKFSRIQFTPDLLPADLVGTMVYNPGKNEFTTKKGPIFANFVLADEINRAPAKVQSALLEAMQERQVTIGEETHQLPRPFLVMATQNPIDQEGTYSLPEAQRDRFLMKVNLDYPSMAEEQKIMQMHHSPDQMLSHKPSQVADIQHVLGSKKMIERIYMDERIEKYILDIVFATRQPEKYKLGAIKSYLQFGASPRATIGLAMASKAKAFIEGRAYVIPEDIRSLVYDVLRHRIGLSFEAEAENINPDNIIQRIIEGVEIP